LDLSILATRGLPKLVCSGFLKHYVYIVERAKFHKLVTKYTIFLISSALRGCNAEMLRDDDMRRKDASVRCLEVLTSSQLHHWRQLLAAGLSDCCFYSQILSSSACFVVVLVVINVTKAPAVARGGRPYCSINLISTITRYVFERSTRCLVRLPIVLLAVNTPR